MDGQQATGGSVISKVNADPVFTTEVFDAIGVHPASISHDLQAVRNASEVVEFFGGFSNGLSALRGVVKGVPVGDRVQHLSEYVTLKKSEFSFKQELKDLKKDDSLTSKERTLIKSDLDSKLKDVVKQIKFYEK